MAKIKYELPIYSFQIDFNGHVSNIVYSQWMEIGRTKLLEALNMPVHEIAQRGFVPVLVHTEITFKQPFHLGEKVYAELWLAELRYASVQMEFCFYKSDRTIGAIAKQKGIFLDTAKNQPRRLLKEEREKFSTFLQN